MTNLYKFLPMNIARRVIFIVYDQFELLDLSGPSSVLNVACKTAGKEAYTIHIASVSGGLIYARSSVAVNTRTLRELNISGSDTVLVVGGEPSAVNLVSQNQELTIWLQNNIEHSERFGSICSGALVLASAGLLDEKKATTHWADLTILKDNFPTIKVEEDALYTVDGNLWTSAGVSSGIDMALAMVGLDHGNGVMCDVAKWLVLYVNRPGSQSQFSQLIDAQSRLNTSISSVVPWLDKNMHRPIKVRDMAEQCAMSERNFYRKFVDAMGITPSKFLTTRRLYRAKQLIESGLPIKAISSKVGYDSELGFRLAFESLYGISPTNYKRMHTL